MAGRRRRVTTLSLAAPHLAIGPRIIVGRLGRRADDGFDSASRTPRGRRDLTVLRFENPPCRIVSIQTGQGASRHLAVRTARPVLDIEHNDAGRNPALYRHGATPPSLGPRRHWASHCPLLGPSERGLLLSFPQFRVFRRLLGPGP